MFIDAATRRSLELTRTATNERTSSLLWTIDQTVTAAGARLLAAQLTAPLLSVEAINSRLDAVEFFVHRSDLTDQLRVLLARCHDIERCLQRVALGRCGPRDLSAIGATLSLAPEIAALMGDRRQSIAASINERLMELDDHSEIVQLLDAALLDDPPINTIDGGFIAGGSVLIDSIDQEK